jgi:hypothetical protein
VVIVFALVAHREDGDGRPIGDLEPNHTAGAAEGNNQFTQKGIGVVRLAAGEGHLLKKSVAALNRCARASPPHSPAARENLAGRAKGDGGN